MTRSPPLRHVAVLALGALASLAAPAGADTSGFRGDGSGRFPDAKPPLEWAPDRNVAWKTKMPNWGNASPVLAGDRLFVTAEPTTLVCVRASDGKVLWSRDVGYLDTVPPAGQEKARLEKAETDALGQKLGAATRELDKLRREARKRDVAPEARARLESLSREVGVLRARYDELWRFRPPESIPIMGSASSTPATDGSSVYVIFGNYVVAAFSLDGKPRWARFVPPADGAHMMGYPKGQSASPIVVGDRLIVPLGKLSAFALDDGRTLWESHAYRDFGTPVLARAGGEAVVLTADGHATRVSDGKDLGPGLPTIYYVGPIADGETGYWIGNVDSNPPNPASAIAMRLPRAGAWKPERLWKVDLPQQRQYSTPLLAEGALHAVHEHGQLTVLDARTGRALLSRDLDIKSVFPSPTLAGGHVYFSGGGVTVVVEARPPFREVARNTLEPFRASPLFVGSRAYVRAEEHLYCLESGGGAAKSAGARKPSK